MCTFDRSFPRTLLIMRWLQVGLLILESISRVVQRIGPIEFESMEKHPTARPPMTADPAAEYNACGDGADGAEPEPPTPPDPPA